MNTSSNISEDKEARFFDYLIILAKHGRLIVFTSFAVMIITFLYLFCSANQYKALVRLLPPQQNLTLSAQLLEVLGGGLTPGKDSGGIGETAAKVLGLKTQGDIYLGIIKGNTVTNSIIKRFNLEQVYKSRYLEDARKTLWGNTAITVDGRGGIITITVTDKDPKLAAAIANAYPEELDKILQDIARREAEGRLAFLEKQRNLAADNLTKAEETLRSFSEKSSVIQIDAQTRGMLQYIAELRAQIDAKEIQIQVLRKQATPMNYDLIRLETELKGLKEKLKATETQMDNCVGDVCLPTSSTPGLGLKYLRLFREVKFQEALYQLFTKMVELARLDISKNVVVIQVIDHADLPEKRVNQRGLPAFWVGLATFLAMIMASFGIEYWKNNKSELKKLRSNFS
ncbi:MAG: GumC family protein [Thermodesulfobacteriota bacterium]